MYQFTIFENFLADYTYTTVVRVFMEKNLLRFCINIVNHVPFYEMFPV
jgi:hypothetical protein